MRHSSITRLATLSSIAGAIALASAAASAGTKLLPARGGPIVGAWQGTVTVVDCVSQAPLGSFKTGQLINYGGTLATTDYEPNPTKSGPGFGYWAPTGPGAYFEKFQFERFNPDGTVAGFQRVTKETTMNGADEKSSTIFSEALAPDGTTVVGSRCAVETAKRFG